MNEEDLSWDNDPNKPDIINIMYKGKRVMGIYIGEAMQGAGQDTIHKIVHDMDNTPWRLSGYGHDWEKVAKEQDFVQNSPKVWAALGDNYEG